MRTGLAQSLVLAFTLSTAATVDAAASTPITVKVMIVSMFGPEGSAWVSGRKLDQAVTLPGLSPDDPALHCGVDGVCQITTGMGYANAAASIAALVYSDQLDLRRTYWLIAGVAGINPHRGTLGSVAWARYLVDGGLQWELDVRSAPPAWPTGYTGINTMQPGDKPALDYRTEVFQLNESLLQRALALSRGVPLTDSAAAQQARAAYPAPGNQPPSVLQCDTVSSDTWTSGTRLSERAEAWTRILTDGQGVQCTTQQEDNAIYEVLKRATAAHRADAQRVMVLRAGSDFDRPAPGGADADNLLNYRAQGGFEPALANLYRAGNPVVDAIVTEWDRWERGAGD